MIDVFEECRKINECIMTGDDAGGRNRLIQLLDYHAENELAYSPLVNRLIRQTGLYPYIKSETATWEDKFVFEAFSVDVGGKEATLHKGQSELLRKLLDGENLVVSAPTSFGKSFIIDAFIAIKKPTNVVIIVPTIALTDETRRRIYKKFSNEYKIITTPDVELAEKNILIFPQERALGYAAKLSSIDLLIVDEFYKVSENFDKDRAPSLHKAILKLSKKAKQRYFLAPNIKEIEDNPLTKGMTFIEMLDFNTVFLERHELFESLRGDEDAKGQKLLEIIRTKKAKSLIYAGAYAQIDKVANLLIEELPIKKDPLLQHFANWLSKNYSANWRLSNLVLRGTGIHNGQLHRSLSQIQIKLFEEPYGFENIVSTSSIIEGVNTSAENVILWRNKNGASKLNDFTYKNIIGRSGRMFKHFVGKVYILEAPPSEEPTQLDIPFPEMILGDLDERTYKDSLTDEQIAKILAYKEEMGELLGHDEYTRLLKNNTFQNSDSYFVKQLATDLRKEPDEWNGFGYLNSENPNDWERLLYKVIRLQKSGWDAEYRKIVAFVKVLSKNWEKTIPELLEELEDCGITIDNFFSLERNVTFKLSSLLGDFNELQKIILDNAVDVSPFISKLSHAFLPPVAYQLEEYGLPRMITRKLHQAGVIDFSDKDLSFHDAIKRFLHVGQEAMLTMECFDAFDRYILSYFFDGIMLDCANNSEKT